MRKGKYLIITSLLFGLHHGFCLTTKPAPNKELIEARRELVLAKETSRRIEIELQQLRADGEAPDDVLKDYDVYLARLQEMITLHHRRVQRMEEGMNAEADGDVVRDSHMKPTFRYSPAPVISLDKEFDQSLSAFDEFILQEFEILDQQKAELSEEESLNGLAAEAAAAVRRLKQFGVDLRSTKNRSENQEKETNDQGVPESFNFSDIEDLENGTIRPIDGRRVKVRSEGFIGDDDIVARQLKEAAEKENDPILKEKLLMEYHAYKRAVNGGPSPETDSDRER